MSLLRHLVICGAELRTPADGRRCVEARQDCLSPSARGSPADRRGPPRPPLSEQQEETGCKQVAFVRSWTKRKCRLRVGSVGVQRRLRRAPDRSGRTGSRAVVQPHQQLHHRQLTQFTPYGLRVISQVMAWMQRAPDAGPSCPSMIAWRSDSTTTPASSSGHGGIAKRVTAACHLNCIHLF
jgi:hypothetical protein